MAYLARTFQGVAHHRQTLLMVSVLPAVVFLAVALPTVTTTSPASGAGDGDEWAWSPPVVYYATDELDARRAAANAKQQAAADVLRKLEATADRAVLSASPVWTSSKPDEVLDLKLVGQPTVVAVTFTATGARTADLKVGANVFTIGGDCMEVEKTIMLDPPTALGQITVTSQGDQLPEGFNLRDLTVWVARK